ncbi:hypothetical protein [Deinococcus frigens]|uniref:hypothetical protein n=1 Tax=Deinococcus frigens TaxID=249403 RepID=UPI0004951764|nr:hypothetical protein [Deinococcus frigens]
MQSVSGQNQGAATGSEQLQKKNDTFPKTLELDPEDYHPRREPLWERTLELDPEDSTWYPQGPYGLRRYDARPEYDKGYPHEESDDLPELIRQCGRRNISSSITHGFKQWWITDSQGEIIHPLETKPSVYTSPAAESDEVSQPFQEMRAFKSASAFHDFLFLIKDVDEKAKAERLRSLARELELTAEHIRKLLELERQR